MITSEYEDRSNCLDDVEVEVACRCTLQFMENRLHFFAPCRIYRNLSFFFFFFLKDTSVMENSEKVRSKSERVFYFIGLVQTLIIFRGLSNCKIVEITKRKMSSSVL